MKTNQVNETKERKSFKEFLVENKGKIITGVGVASTVAISYLYCKHRIDLSKAFMKIKAKDGLNEFVMEELWYKAEVTEDIVVNSGIIEQARATINRKRDTLVSKLNCLTNMDQTSDVIKEKISEIKGGISGFDTMLDKCEELEYLYKCRVKGENIIE